MTGPRPSVSPSEWLALAERVAGARRVERTGGCQLGGRIEQAGDDQGQGQLAAALRALTRQQSVELEPSCGSQGGQNVAMGKRAFDLDSLTGRHQGVAAQRGAQQLDPLRRPVGKIFQGAVFDLVAVAVALAQQDRGAGAAVGDDGDIHV